MISTQLHDERPGPPPTEKCESRLPLHNRLEINDEPLIPFYRKEKCVPLFHCKSILTCRLDM